MDIKEYTKQVGSFLKAEDVKNAKMPIFIPTGEGIIKKNEKFGTDRIHVVGEFNGEERVFDMSKTNARVVEKKLGSDTSKWIGSEFVLDTYKTKTKDGKIVDVVNVKEVNKGLKEEK
jgi:hypothetical protein